MNSARSVTVMVGESLLWQGHVVRVVEFDGRSVLLRLDESRYSRAELAELVSHARGLEPVADDGDSGLILAGLSAAERDLVAQRGAHVREVLTGYTSGHADLVGPDEPRSQFADGVGLKDRYRAKAAELSVGVRTIESWVAAYREGGEAALVDNRRRPAAYRRRPGRMPPG